MGIQDAPLGDGGPAPWIDHTTLACAEGVDVAIAQRAVAIATGLLWSLSGRRFGASPPITERPCLRSSCVPSRRYAHQARPCDRLGATLVLSAPVYEVTEVLIDGDPFDDWRVDDHRLLVRTDGLRWPSTQDLDLPTTDEGTWSYTYSVGLAVPATGLYAAEVLACEYVKAMTSGKCRLPQRLRQVSRQGLSFDIIDPQEFLVDGRLGINEVDTFLVAVNPHGLSSRSTVMSPDRPRPRRAGLGS